MEYLIFEKQHYDNLGQLIIAELDLKDAASYPMEQIVNIDLTKIFDKLYSQRIFTRTNEDGSLDVYKISDIDILVSQTLAEIGTGDFIRVAQGEEINLYKKIQDEKNILLEINPKTLIKEAVIQLREDLKSGVVKYSDLNEAFAMGRLTVKLVTAVIPALSRSLDSIDNSEIIAEFKEK